MASMGSIGSGLLGMAVFIVIAGGLTVPVMLIGGTVGVAVASFAGLFVLCAIVVGLPILALLGIWKDLDRLPKSIWVVLGIIQPGILAGVGVAYLTLPHPHAVFTYATALIGVFAILLLIIALSGKAADRWIHRIPGA